MNGEEMAGLTRALNGLCEVYVQAAAPGEPDTDRISEVFRDIWDSSEKLPHALVMDMIMAFLADLEKRSSTASPLLEQEAAAAGHEK